MDVEVTHAADMPSRLREQLVDIDPRFCFRRHALPLAGILEGHFGDSGL
jgi:hypothetical protein